MSGLQIRSLNASHVSKLGMNLLCSAHDGFSKKL